MLDLTSAWRVSLRSLQPPQQKAGQSGDPGEVGTGKGAERSARWFRLSVYLNFPCGQDDILINLLGGSIQAKPVSICTGLSSVMASLRFTSLKHFGEDPGGVTIPEDAFPDSFSSLVVFAHPAETRCKNQGPDPQTKANAVHTRQRRR